jgi:signal transduction histidine kinase
VFRALRLKLIGSAIAVVALVLIAAGALVYAILTQQFDAAVDAELDAASAGLQQVVLSPIALGIKVPVDPGITAGVPLDPAAKEALRGATEGIGYQGQPLSDANSTFSVQWLNDQVIGERGTVPVGLPDVGARAAVKPDRVDRRTVSRNGQRYRLLTRVLPLPGNKGSLALQVGVSLASRDRQQRTVLLGLAGGGLAGLALAAVGGLFLTGRALAPLQLAFARQRRFIADASHELRTPLSLVRLEAEALAADLHAEREAHPLLREVDRIARLVDSLLTLARLDDGALPFEREPVHVASLLEDAAAAARMLAAVDVTVVVSAVRHQWVLGDRDRLRQVLIIAIDNACRATPAGGRILLAAERRGVVTTLSVSDSGPGIPAEYLTRVFERFYRVDRARGRNGGGAGLGLAIAHEIVQRLGGEIALLSPPGGGTTLEVRLPALPPPHAATELSESAAEPVARISDLSG